MKRSWFPVAAWGVLLLTGSWSLSADAPPDAGKRAGGAGEAVEHDALVHDALVHDAQCGGCSAEAVWNGFLKHLRKLGREDLIPPALLPPSVVPLDDEPALAGSEDAGDDAAKATKAARRALQLSLLAGDPIRGVLFRMSPDLVNLDAIHREAADAENLPSDAREKAAGLAARLRESKDPYLQVYGTLHGAQLDLQAEKHAEAAKAFEELVKSCYFLPRSAAHRGLALAYKGLGDDTLALLEVQFYLVDLSVGDDAGRTWAQDELKQIRDQKNPGPLHDSEAIMRSVSTLLAGLDVGGGTQAKERRVEDVLEKVAKLLEKKGGT